MQKTPFPIVLGICLDAEAIWLGIDPENAGRPSLLSHGTYAVLEGLPPLLDLLDRHDVSTTFFVPGITADRYPDAVAEIHRRGHEIGGHGHRHLSPTRLSRAEERDELVRGNDSIANIINERPVTWRSPSWEWSEHTLDLMMEDGITVSTNFHDRAGPYRHTRDGQALPLVELPVQWHLADAPYFMHGGRMERVIRTASEVESLWQEEFLGHYDWPGAFFHLTLHVQLIAQPGRLMMLDRLLTYMKRYSRSRFMHSREVAATVG
ncbi:polysaccharide deacetylase family protein [uncultured Roseibium sp.]|uniref:polysaccharide deacetylase family protein n=1 Tax=uncultured Roseibium sp. TaxID=1936171 RepID=UPI003217C130